MSWDNSFEENITNGYVQKIKSFSISFDKIVVVFENCHTWSQKIMQFSRVLSFSMQSDDLDNWDDDMDIMAYRTLIGFGFKIVGNVYHYVLKIDDYEIEIKSLKFVTLSDII